MKRVGNLFEETFSIDNLYEAYLVAIKGKRKKKQSHEFMVNIGTEINSLHTRIHNGTYMPDPYNRFIIKEPKEREILAPSFRDIVVQHAIYRIIYSIFNKIFIRDSYACRKGYGTHRCRDRLIEFVKSSSPNSYYLQLDIRKFFHSIDCRVLRILIEKKIKDKKLVEMIMLFTNDESTLGLPIGNLLSQILALVFLNLLDHFIKERLRVKKYIRYVDDLVIVDLTLDQAKSLKETISQFLKEYYNLDLSKHIIQKIKRGINYVGFRVWRNICLIRKYSLYKCIRFFKEDRRESYVSILGHAKGTTSHSYLIFKYLYYQFKKIFETNSTRSFEEYLQRDREHIISSYRRRFSYHFFVRNLSNTNSSSLMLDLRR